MDPEALTCHDCGSTIGTVALDPAVRYIRTLRHQAGKIVFGDWVTYSTATIRCKQCSPRPPEAYDD